MTAATRAALIEYTDDFPATIPNVVVFQFNPEQLVRTVEIPPRPTGPSALEVDQAGDPPTETISFTARFDAADQLHRDLPIARASGIAPALASLQQMAQPSSLVDIGKQAIDAIGSLLSSSGDGAALSVPRVHYPRVLFVWGVYRILPVAITQLSITESKFDFLLNPTQADVQLTLSVIAPSRCADDLLMIGAAAYSNIQRVRLAALNIPETVVETVLDITSVLGG